MHAAICLHSKTDNACSTMYTYIYLTVYYYYASYIAIINKYGIVLLTYYNNYYTVTPQLTIPASTVSTIHGESVQLTCNHANPNAIPIRMRWYRNNKLLLTGEKYTISVVQPTHSYSLQIHNVSETDEGAYNCIADSLYSSETVGTIHLKGTYIICFIV